MNSVSRLITTAGVLLLAAATCQAAARVRGVCYNLPDPALPGDLAPIRGVNPDTRLPETIAVEVRELNSDDPNLPGNVIPIRNFNFNNGTGEYSFDIDLPGG